MKLNEIAGSAGNFLTAQNKIEAWLKKMEIKNYTINDNGVVDVNDDVYLYSKELTHIPVRFGKIAKGFYCMDNELTSLAGCPSYVGGNFNCSHNKLTTLVGGPQQVGSHFECGSNELTSLIGCPSQVGRSFYCYKNTLTSLEELPQHIRGAFNCMVNKLTSHTIGLILTGCTHLEADGNWAKIIRKYLGRPDDIFECQAELINKGYEEFALL